MKRSWRSTQLETVIQDHQRLIWHTGRNTIPEDVWREIFYHCLPTEHDAIMHHSEPPSLFTQVSKTWREIALHTPRLWASMHIPVQTGFSFRYPDAPSRQIQMLSEWLARTSTAPLSITLGRAPFYRNSFKPKSQEHLSLEVILPFSKQWHRLSIATTRDTISDVALLKPCDLTSLKILEIEHTSSAESDPETSPFLHSYHRTFSLLHAPNLCRVSLTRLESDISILSLPWHQLTNVSLDVVDYPKTAPQIVALMKSCPKLISFKLRTMYTPLNLSSMY